MTGPSFAVVDDFYREPNSVRDLALRSASWMPPKTEDGRSYGRETELGYYTDEIVESFAAIVGGPISFDPRTMGFGVFAHYDGAASVDLSTHFDDSEWSSIVYLVPDDLCQGGLSFFRHISTGFYGPPSDSLARAAGFVSAEHFLRDVYYPDKLEPGRWERIDFIPMRFNRLVVLAGASHFHRADSGFGSEPRTGRLTQRFFFNGESRGE